MSQSITRIAFSLAAPYEAIVGQIIDLGSRRIVHDRTDAKVRTRVVREA